MIDFAYLFERFPSFGQTFCYREVAELDRQDVARHRIGTRISPNGSIIFRRKRNYWKTFDAPQKNRSSAWTLCPRLMNGGAAPISCDSTRRFTLVCAYGKWALVMSTRISPAWPRARLSGLINFFLSLSVLPHTRTISSCRRILKSDWANSLIRHGQSSRKRTTRRNSCMSDFQIAPVACTAFTTVSISPTLLAEHGKPFRCEIVGEGPLENDLRNEIAQHGLQRYVILAGTKPQSELRRRLAAANVFVLPSVIDPEGGMDNLPTVIMEAMATALPVVSTNIGGIPEMVIENETGFLVQPGDAVAMADAINKIIGDSSVARRLGQSGYERARTLFSIEKNVRELCALLS